MLAIFSIMLFESLSIIALLLTIALVIAMAGILFNLMCRFWKLVLILIIGLWLSGLVKSFL